MTRYIYICKYKRSQSHGRGHMKRLATISGLVSVMRLASFFVGALHSIQLVLYLIIVFAITIFYAGVGNPVVRFNSMTTALFLPVLLTFFWIAERYRRQLQRSRYARLVNIVHFTLMALPVALRALSSST